MRILIDNCVPLNNGDAALIFSVADQLEKKFKNNVSFATRYFESSTNLYSDKTWFKSILDYKLFRILLKFPSSIGKIFAFFFVLIFSNYYKENDLIISAPGGYIHSYYGKDTEIKLFTLYICKKYLNKTVGIYSQSIGNLSKKDQKMLYKYGKDLDFIYVRDAKSYERALEYGLSDNVTLTKDAAFMMKSIETNINKKATKKVAISLRSWNNENRDKIKYYKLIQKIVNILLNNGYEVTFISTCQGLEAYVDDSNVAKEFLIFAGLAKNNRIIIDSEYRDVYALQEKIKSFDYVIGTRLHMCILSLINNVPAINISYEEKGREAYKYLDIECFSIDYNHSDDIEDILTKFLSLNNIYWNQLWENILSVHKAQIEFLKVLVYDSSK